MFDYYCRNFGFDCVEINSTFYRLPAAKSMASLARRSPENFHFMVKLFNAFTHNLLRATPENFARFHHCLAPLAESGKLRGLLAQFPSAFLPNRQTRAWLRYLREKLAPFPLFVEFRHRRWENPETFAFLRKEEIGYCITDLPPVGSLPRFLPIATNGIAYLRLHGRNREWYRPATSRHDYQYSDHELRNILAGISGISPQPTEIFVFFNNCHAGTAVRSAKRCLMLNKESILSLPDIGRACVNPSPLLSCRSTLSPPAVPAFRDDNDMTAPS